MIESLIVNTKLNVVSLRFCHLLTVFPIFFAIWFDSTIWLFLKNVMSHVTFFYQDVAILFALFGENAEHYMIDIKKKMYIWHIFFAFCVCEKCAFFFKFNCEINYDTIVTYQALTLCSMISFLWKCHGSAMEVPRKCHHHVFILHNLLFWSNLRILYFRSSSLC